MKKVLALVLAVLMLSTMAFAAKIPISAGAANGAGLFYSDITPGSTVKLSREGIIKGGGRLKLTGTLENGEEKNFRDSSKSIDVDMENYVLRAITSENYSISSVKYAKMGKSLVSGVKINDKDDCVDITLKDDLTNTTGKDFEVTFKLKGKVKFTTRDSADVNWYNAQVKQNNMIKTANGIPVGDNTTPDATGRTSFNPLTDIQNYSTVGVNNNASVGINTKVNLPDITFTLQGSVGYGKVEVSLGDSDDEDFETLDELTVYNGSSSGYSNFTNLSNDPNPTPMNNPFNTANADVIDIDNDIIKFVSGPAGTVGEARRVAGAYTADALLYQEYNDALTLEARVYANDTLYFSVDNAPISNVIDKLADVNADIDFYLFNADKSFTTFNSTATLKFTTADSEDDWYVYEVVNNGLVPRGEYDEDEGCWIIRTRTLGQYVVSDSELSLYEIEGGAENDPANGNPDTGANDVVGIAAALAAVALVSAAAVSLKK